MFKNPEGFFIIVGMVIGTVLYPSVITLTATAFVSLLYSLDYYFNKDKPTPEEIVEQAIQESAKAPKPITKIPKQQICIDTYRANKKAYLDSPQWKIKANKNKGANNYTCQMCGSTERLNTHHITYKNLYREQPEDLACLCEDCHTAIHSMYGYPQTVEEYELFYGPPFIKQNHEY